MGIEIVRVLNAISAASTVSDANLITIKSAIDRINVPKTHAEFGFTHRIFDNRQFAAQKGLVTMFLLSNPAIVNLGKPIQSEGIAADAPDRWVKLTSMVEALNRPSPTRRYLDLGTRRLIKESTAQNLARLGVDGGILSGAPPGAPEEKKDETVNV